MATLRPPVAAAVVAALGATAVLAAPPPGPEVEAARPPVPPLPPLTLALVEFWAVPVVPDSAVAWDEEPELALDLAVPTAVAGPVSPLGAAVVGGVGVWAALEAGGMVAGTELDVELVWATAAPPQNTRRAAMSAPTEADTLEIFRAEPGLPVFMLIPCR